MCLRIAGNLGSASDSQVSLQHSQIFHQLWRILYEEGFTPSFQCKLVPVQLQIKLENHCNGATEKYDCSGQALNAGSRDATFLVLPINPSNFKVLGPSIWKSVIRLTQGVFFLVALLCASLWLVSLPAQQNPVTHHSKVTDWIIVLVCLVGGISIQPAKFGLICTWMELSSRIWCGWKTKCTQISCTNYIQ